MELLTNSRITARARCHQLEYYRYVQRLVPNKRQWVLDTGSSFHAGMEEINRGKTVEEAITTGIEYLTKWVTPQNEEEAQELEQAKVLVEVMIRQAAKTFPKYESVHTEYEFQVPIVNPTTGKKSRTFVLAGKADGIVRADDGSLWLLEYKTTGVSLDQFRMRYGLDNQITLYLYALNRALGEPLQGVLYRVVYKNRTKPKTSKGVIVETMDEYKERLIRLYDAEPERHITEDMILRTPEQLKRFENELWIETQERLFEKRCGVVRRNTSSCTDFGGCPYRAACLGLEGWEEQYHIASTAHTELPSQAVGA